MKNGDNSKKILSGLFWKFSERFLAQIVSFIISILLARLLLPEDYGIISLVLVFIDLANVFVVNGFNTALIQNKDADETDFSTMFYCSLVFSIIFYIVLFISAEPIANFYDNIMLVSVIRILSLKMPLSAVNSIQQAYVSRNLMFKKFFFSTLISTIFSGIIGIILAFYDYGVWALVAQYLINSSMSIIILFITIEWKPKLLFSIKRAKKMLSYGWKITLGSLTDELYLQIRSLIIGKKYSSAMLAYYNKGNQFPKLFINNINSSISSVLFPVMSNYSDNKQKIKVLCQKFIQGVSYVISPLMIGMFVISPSLVSILLTDNWVKCVPFLQIACVTYMLTPINSANIQAIKAAGRSDMFLKMEIIKKVIGILILFISMNFGVYYLALSTIVVQILCNIINIFPTKKLLGYGYKEQICDIIPSIAISVLMGLIINCLSYFNLSKIVLMTLQILLGIIIYLLLSNLFKVKGFKIISQILKRYIIKGKKKKIKI